MLSEVPHPRQIAGEGYRRWFTDGYFDLIVWYERAGGSVTGFQLCYDKPGTERALTWRAGRGYLHERVDDGEGPGAFKMSPVLLPDGLFDSRSISERFDRAAGGVDPEIRKLVLDRLGAYGATAAGLDFPRPAE
jgi:hypothetical protein